MALWPVRCLSSRSWLAMVFTLAVLAPTTAVVTASGTQLPGPPALPKQRSVPGKAIGARSVPPLNNATTRTFSPAAAVFPLAGEAVVAVPAGARRGQLSRAAQLPVSVGAPASAARVPDRVRVRVFDRQATVAAGVDGVLLRVTMDGARDAAAAGAVSLAVAYSDFRWAYGGDWASRLRLVGLPDCALTTPELAECQAQTPLPARNDISTGRVVADAAPAGVSTADGSGEGGVVALAATVSGGAGDYRATSLSPSASWQVSTHTGDFTWSYPMRTPPVPGDLGVDLALSYSSGAVDGQVATTNNQTSWLGEGLTMWPGFIERKYRSCVDDAVSSKPGDLCWGGDYVSVSLGGRASELIRDSASGAWRLVEDDGTRVERLTGAANGALGGEYWRLTTTDGSQFSFGRNRLPGWVSGKPETNSTWTVPVFGDVAGEPCNKAAFTDSWCQQAYRWNLDHVVDVNGNALAHYYAKETNYYGRNLTASAGTQYVRGGYLVRTEYGLRTGTEYTTAAVAMVAYGVSERCLRSATECAELNITAHPEFWPDVPADRICNAGSSCTNKYSPTFFTRKRLTSVTTRVRSGTGYRDVERWDLQHTFPATGDGLGPALWLSKIVHVGLVGGSATLPAVSLGGTQLENRVDAIDGLAPMIKYRLSAVRSETGGGVSVNYSAKDCVRGSRMPASPESNTMRCFPQHWLPEGSFNTIQDWFHKYVTTRVVSIDNTGGAPFDVTSYEYVGGTAWHFDEEWLLPANKRTWSSWRGYQRVRITHGDASEQRSQTEHLFLRGMDGDTLPGGASRSVTVTDSESGVVRDHWRLQGFQRESMVLNGPGGAQVSGEIYDPWLSAPTATQGSRQGVMVDTAAEWGREALAGGGWRRTETRTTFDAYGMAFTISDLGDIGNANDDTCTRHTSARNTGIWLLDPVARTEKVSAPCAVTPSRPGDVISDERFFFDGSSTFGTTPTRGEVTRTEKLADWTTGAIYAMTGRSVYDSYGRQTESYDAENNKTGTAFTPTSGGPVTAITVTNPRGHVNTTTVEPAWGTTVTMVDANTKRTDLTYDPLGRLTNVWLPGRAKTSQSASVQFAYTIPTDATGAVNGPVVVTSRVLRNDGQYTVAYQMFDSLLRPRQTQHPAPGGGRLITDNSYNTRGQEVKTNHPYYNAQAPSAALFLVADNQVPGQTLTAYDGADRVTAEIFRVLGVEKWRTTTTYGGDRVHVDPPAGETATTVVNDVDDRAVELRQYHGGSPTGTYDATKYTYTHAGELETVTDAAGNTWRRRYDLRGRLIESTDPDGGTSRETYDNLDQVRTSIDGRGRTLAFDYDQLGRRTEVRQGSASGPLLASWTHDTLVKGQLTSATRWVGANAYTTAVTGYTDLYQPTGASITLPLSEGALAGTYTTGFTYNPDGTVKTSTLPAAGQLAAETLTYGYNELGMLTTLSSPLASYVAATTWNKLGSVQQRTYGSVGNRVTRTHSYEEGTERLSRAKTDIERLAATQADVGYNHDPAGNVTRIADTPPAANAPSDVQCFRYDHLRRLTEAWAATDDCASASSLAVLGGAVPYWHSYTYDAVGNRKTETQHNSAGDTTRTYTYPAAGQVRPHTLSTITEQTPTGTTTRSYGYDTAGNTTSRPGQSLTWDDEGNLASVTAGPATTSFLYDAVGNRLLRRDPNTVTAYLGTMELRLAKVSGLVTGTRYYRDGNATVAVRTYDNNLYWQVGDHHNTAGMMLEATNLTITRRRFTPFGAPRGATPAWKGEHGFVDGPVDATTGLTHLGAREYDPTIGRFISVDPVIDTDDPQQMHGYAYANNSPVTFTDPDGLLANCGPDGFRCGMNPDYSRKGQYVGPKPPRPATKKVIPIHRQTDGDRLPYRPINRSSYHPAARAQHHFSRLPDGGYERDPDRSFKYTPYKPPPRPKPKPSAWQRAWKFTAEVTGIDAARRCLTEGSVSGCLETAVAVATVLTPGSAIVVRLGVKAIEKGVAKRAAATVGAYGRKRMVATGEPGQNLAQQAERNTALARRMDMEDRAAERPDFRSLPKRIDPWKDTTTQIGRPFEFPRDGITGQSNVWVDLLHLFTKFAGK